MSIKAAPSTAAESSADGAPRERKIAPYDFRRPNKVSRDHVRALQLVHETFARQFSTILSTTLRALSPVSVRSIEQQTYDEYITPLRNPTYLAILAVDPLPGQGIFHLPLPAAMEIVDRLLGGPGGGDHPERPMTEIEVGVLRGLLERVMRELTYAFESFIEVSTRITTQESNPQFAQVVALSDMVVTAVYDLKIGEHAWEASLCFPFSMLQPALDAFTASKQRDEASGVDPELVEGLLQDHLQEAPVEVSVAFNTVRLASRDIVDLRTGDVLPLRHSTENPLTVNVGGVPCFTALPGKRGRRLACMVVGGDDQLAGEVVGAATAQQTTQPHAAPITGDPA